MNRRYGLLFQPDPAGDGAGTGGEANKAAEQKPDAGAGADNAGENGTSDAGAQKTFSQEEVNKIIDQRLKRAEKGWADKVAEDSKKAAMSEADRLKSEVDAANLKATKAGEAANQRVVTAEARVALLVAGIKAERVGRALKMLELADIAVDDDGTPDQAAIDAAVKALIEDMPEFVAAAGAAKGGTDFGGANTKGPPLTKELIESMTPEEFQSRYAEIQSFYAKK